MMHSPGHVCWGSLRWDELMSGRFERRRIPGMTTKNPRLRMPIVASVHVGSRGLRHNHLRSFPTTIAPGPCLPVPKCQGRVSDLPTRLWTLRDSSSRLPVSKCDQLTPTTFDISCRTGNQEPTDSGLISPNLLKAIPSVDSCLRRLGLDASSRSPVSAPTTLVTPSSSPRQRWPKAGR